MRIASLLAGPAVAVAIGLTAGSAQAAPAGGGLGGLENDPAASSAAEKTYWSRQCEWRYGHRHCWQVWVQPNRWWGHRHHYNSHRWDRRHHWQRHHRRWR